MKKRFVAFLLVLIMVLGMLPVSAFAADGDVSPQALNTGHKIDVTFTVLYVGDEFNIGYNYGTSEKTQFVCQYSTPHSDTAYNNHTIAISDIKAAADSGYQIVGWSKESNANPKTWALSMSGTTACNKGTSIYLVAKDPNPQVTYTLTYDKNTTDNVTNMPETQTETNSKGYATFPLSGKIPVRNGYTFKGGQTGDGKTVAPNVTLTKGAPRMTIYAVWEENTPPVPDKPDAPKFDDYKLTTVKIKCVTSGVKHNDSENALAGSLGGFPGSYTIGTDVKQGAYNGETRYYVEGTLAQDVTPFVNTFNGVYPGHTEADSPAHIRAFRLWYFPENAGSTEKVWKQDVIPTVYVKCEVTPPVDKPNPPTENNLLGLTIAKVYCAMPANHGSEDFTYLSGTLDTSRTYTVDENGFCTVYLHVAPYVASYNGHYTSSSHARRAEDPTTVPVTLVYNTERWEVAKEGDAEALADIPVYCAETPVEPAKPTALDGSFAIVCKNNEATHAHKADYIATPSQYTISDVQTDEQGYYVTATVTVAPNLAAYNNLTLTSRTQR